MKVIIAGSRQFSNYDVLKKYCDHILQNQTDVEIVSGTCEGADLLGERYAEEKGFRISRFPADWEQFGKRAGYIRNKQMAVYADAVILFWDGKSRGTKLMFDLAKKNGLEVRIKVIKTCAERIRLHY